tara:strand:+ start:1059 stop:1382 length:324 start_codon:yes stop_codon:yes gene_type:complete
MPTVKQVNVAINTDDVFGATTTGQQVLEKTSNRRSLSIQNVGATKVYVRFGSPPALGGTKRYSFILAPASGSEEGDGGVLTVDNYNGSVYVMTASGTSTVIATDFIG